jgi:hypothetical protein
MRRLALLIVTFLAATPARAAVGCIGSDADECRWSTGDYVLQFSFSALQVVDIMQTRYFLDHDLYPESNPITGAHPSRLRLGSYMAAVLAGHALVSAALPKPYRTYWQILWIGVQGEVVRENAVLVGGFRLELP